MTIIRKLLEFSVLFFFVKSATAGKIYNVLDYKARGDGKSDDTNAFLEAWRTVCADKNSPRLLIPSRKNFLINKLILQGPCRSNIHVQIDGSITAPKKIWTKEKTSLLLFADIDNLEIGGSGTIDGQGAIWWQCSQCTKPYLLAFDTCQNLVVRDIHLRNSPSKHLTFNKCTDVIVHRIRITAPGDSPNTDGIVMQESQRVRITRSRIGTGDDCIAILTGSYDVHIRRCTCGPSHGISIGSLGGGYTEASVERIHVFKCRIFNSMNGVRIKTWQGGSGYAKDITFERIKVSHVDTPIVIDQTYMSEPASQEKAVAISNVTFTNIYGSSTQEEAVKIECSATSPCTGLTVKNITLYREGHDNVSAICENAYGTTNGKVIPALGALRK